MVKFSKIQKRYLEAVISGSLRRLEKVWEVPFKMREAAIEGRVLKTIQNLPEE